MTETDSLPPPTPTAAGPGNASRTVVAMLRELPPLERTALDLAHSGGLAVPAIAQALGEDPADVRRALRAALLHIGRAASTTEPATAYATFLLP